MTAERAKELQQTLIWLEFVAELNDIIAMESAKLLSCTVETVVAQQEKIKALQFVKMLPEHIADRE